MSCSEQQQEEAPKLATFNTTHLFFEEENTPHYSIRLALKKIMFESASKFQHVQVIETAQFGKTLVLDGKTQSCQTDEYIYHESLVHPAMLLHPNPKSVYVGGGGELATTREVLRHKSVEKCLMVDIDEVVVDICKKELPEWGQECWKDPRLTVQYGDARAGLENYEGKFDVIIMDIADPIEAGPGYVLYTEEFYKFAVTKLNPGGVIVTQSGPCSLYNYDECFTTIHKTLGTAFEHVLGFNSDVPSFSSNWGFNLAFNGSENERASFADWSPEKINELIAARIDGNPLRYYDGRTHRGIFGLSKPIRDAIAKEDRIMTIENPVFMY